MANILDELIRLFHGIRYDVPERTLRGYNRMRFEKNPNRVKFYALNESDADNYRKVFNDEGEDVTALYPVTRTDKDIEGRYFDMQKDFRNLDTYRKYIEGKRNDMEKDLERIRTSTGTFRRKRDLESVIRAYEENLKNLEEQENERLEHNNFQFLSDGALQDILGRELKDGGYDGYYVGDHEIAVFPWAKSY